MAQYFKLHGLVGMLIAVALLLTILFVFSMKAISVQQEQAQNFYKIEKPLEIKMFDSETEKKHLVSAN